MVTVSVLKETGGLKCLGWTRDSLWARAYESVGVQWDSTTAPCHTSQEETFGFTAEPIGSAHRQCPSAVPDTQCPALKVFCEPAPAHSSLLLPASVYDEPLVPAKYLFPIVSCALNLITLLLLFWKCSAYID